MKRLMKVFVFGSMFACIGLAVFGLLATEALRTSSTPIANTPIPIIPSTLPTIHQQIATLPPMQNELLLITTIPDTALPVTVVTTSTGEATLPITATLAIPSGSPLDATWTAQVHAAGTVAASYQNEWRATMTQWAVEYAVRQLTATAHAP